MNKAKCKNCGDEIESVHRQDWVCCSCYNEAEELEYKFYERIKGLDISKGDVHKILCVFRELTGRGFFLDGGNIYNRCGGNLEDIQWLK